MWRNSTKPPLHPKILVGPKTPHNPIVVVDLDKGDDGLIDLTAIPGGGTSQKRNMEGMEEPRGAPEETNMMETEPAQTSGKPSGFGSMYRKALIGREKRNDGTESHESSPELATEERNPSEDEQDDFARRSPQPMYQKAINMHLGRVSERKKGADGTNEGAENSQSYSGWEQEYNIHDEEARDAVTTLPDDGSETMVVVQAQDLDQHGADDEDLSSAGAKAGARWSRPWASMGSTGLSHVADSQHSTNGSATAAYQGEDKPKNVTLWSRPWSTEPIDVMDTSGKPVYHHENIIDCEDSDNELVSEGGEIPLKGTSGTAPMCNITSSRCNGGDEISSGEKNVQQTLWTRPWPTESLDMDGNRTHGRHPSVGDYGELTELNRNFEQEDGGEGEVDFPTSQHAGPLVDLTCMPSVGRETPDFATHGSSQETTIDEKVHSEQTGSSHVDLTNIHPPSNTEEDAEEDVEKLSSPHASHLVDLTTIASMESSIDANKSETESDDNSLLEERGSEQAKERKDSNAMGILSNSPIQAQRHSGTIEGEISKDIDLIRISTSLENTQSFASNKAASELIRVSSSLDSARNPGLKSLEETSEMEGTRPASRQGIITISSSLEKRTAGPRRVDSSSSNNRKQTRDGPVTPEPKRVISQEDPDHMQIVRISSSAELTLLRRQRSKSTTDIHDGDASVTSPMSRRDRVLERARALLSSPKPTVYKRSTIKAEDHTHIRRASEASSMTGSSPILGRSARSFERNDVGSIADSSFSSALPYLKPIPRVSLTPSTTDIQPDRFSEGHTENRAKAKNVRLQTHDVMSKSSKDLSQQDSSDDQRMEVEEIPSGSQLKSQSLKNATSQEEGELSPTESAFSKIRKRLSQLEAAGPGSESCSDKEDSETETENAFLNIRKRLVRLEMDDFRDIVLSKSHEQHSSGHVNSEHVNQSVMALIDNDDKQGIAIAPILSNYSQDLAISDCDSYSRAEEKNKSNMLSPIEEAAVTSAGAGQETEALASNDANVEENTSVRTETNAGCCVDGTQTKKETANAQIPSMAFHQEQAIPTATLPGCEGNTSNAAPDTKVTSLKFGNDMKNHDTTSYESRTNYESDASETMETQSKISLQSYLETDDSDLDTNFESSSVPMLVRMLDRGCAWLEENNCGLDQPSLLRETRGKRPPVPPSYHKKLRRRYKSSRSERSFRRRGKGSSRAASTLSGRKQLNEEDDESWTYNASQKDTAKSKTKERPSQGGKSTNKMENGHAAEEGFADASSVEKEITGSAHAAGQDSSDSIASSYESPIDAETLFDSKDPTAESPVQVQSEANGSKYLRSSSFMEIRPQSQPESPSASLDTASAPVPLAEPYKRDMGAAENNQSWIKGKSSANDHTRVQHPVKQHERPQPQEPTRASPVHEHVIRSSSSSHTQEPPVPLAKPCKRDAAENNQSWIKGKSSANDQTRVQHLVKQHERPQPQEPTRASPVHEHVIRSSSSSHTQEQPTRASLVHLPATQLPFQSPGSWSDPIQVDVKETEPQVDRPDAWFTTPLRSSTDHPSGENHVVAPAKRLSSEVENRFRSKSTRRVAQRRPETMRRSQSEMKPRIMDEHITDLVDMPVEPVKKSRMKPERRRKSSKSTLRWEAHSVPSSDVVVASGSQGSSENRAPPQKPTNPAKFDSQVDEQVEKSPLRSQSRDPPSLSESPATTNFQTRLQQRLARIRGDDSVQMDDDLTSADNRSKASPTRVSRDPEEVISAEWLGQMTPQRNNAGGPESPSHTRRSSRSRGMSSGSISHRSNDHPKRQQDPVATEMIELLEYDFMNMAEEERLVALELAEKLRRRAVNLKARKKTSKKKRLLLQALEEQ